MMFIHQREVYANQKYQCIIAVSENQSTEKINDILLRRSQKICGFYGIQFTSVILMRRLVLVSIQ